MLHKLILQNWRFNLCMDKLSFKSSQTLKEQCHIVRTPAAHNKTGSESVGNCSDDMTAIVSKLYVNHNEFWGKSKYAYFAYFFVKQYDSYTNLIKQWYIRLHREIVVIARAPAALKESQMETEVVRAKVEM